MNKEAALIIYMAVSIIIGAIGSILLKKGASNIKVSLSLKNIINTIKNYRIMLGISLHIIATACLVFALQIAELSLVYPLTSISYILVNILSVYLLNEKMNHYKIAGIIFIMLGVILVTQ